MSETLKDITELINDRADAKLKADLKVIDDFVYSKHILLQGISVNIGSIEKPHPVNLYRIFDKDYLGKQVLKNNTERYRAAEARLFLEDVASLRKDVDNLLNL